jgi:hypothetical protein
MALPPRSPRSASDARAIWDEYVRDGTLPKPYSPRDTIRTRGPVEAPLQYGDVLRIHEAHCLKAPPAPNVAIGTRFLGVLTGVANDWRVYAVPVDHPAHDPGDGEPLFRPIDALGGWVD